MRFREDMLHYFFVYHWKILRAIIIQLLIKGFKFTVFPYLFFLLFWLLLIRIRIFYVDRPIIVFFLPSWLRSLVYLSSFKFLLPRFFLEGRWDSRRRALRIWDRRYCVISFILVVIPGLLAHRCWFIKCWLFIGLIVASLPQPLDFFVDNLSIIVVLSSDCFLFPLL